MGRLCSMQYAIKTKTNWQVSMTLSLLRVISVWLRTFSNYYRNLITFNLPSENSIYSVRLKFQWILNHWNVNVCLISARCKIIKFNTNTVNLIYLPSEYICFACFIKKNNIELNTNLAFSQGLAFYLCVSALMVKKFAKKLLQIFKVLY